MTTQPRDRRTVQSAGRISNDLLLLLAIVIWGFNFTAVKIGVSHIAPLAYNAVRFSLATILTMGVLAIQARRTGDLSLLVLPRRSIIPVILVGLAGHTIYQALFTSGLARSTPGNASLLLATAPIWVALFSMVLGSERVNRSMLAGILISFAGIVVVVTGGGELRFGRDTLMGNILLVLSAIMWAVFTIGSKPLLGRFSSLKLSAWSMAAGTIPMILIGIPDIRSQDWGAVPPIAWAALVYAAALALTFCYTIWYISVQRLGNVRTVIYSNLIPVFAILFAWLALGDKLSALQLLGGAIVLVGLVVTRRGGTSD